MRKLVNEREGLNSNLVLIDARSLAQFTGEEAGAEVPHAGHIPGAVICPSESTSTSAVPFILLNSYVRSMALPGYRRSR